MFNNDRHKPREHFKSVSVIIVVAIMQFRPLVPAPQPQQFIPLASQHFQPVGQSVPLMNAGLPPQTPQPQFPPLMQQLPARPVPPVPSHLPPPPQAMSLPNSQPNVQAPSLYPPGLGTLGRPLPVSYAVRPLIKTVLIANCYDLL